MSGTSGRAELRAPLKDGGQGKPRGLPYLKHLTYLTYPTYPTYDEGRGRSPGPPCQTLR
jgi:hypothetical protein